MLVSSSSYFLFCTFFQRVERVAVFCWRSCAASSFKCFCVSSRLSRSVLKKSASVFAKDPPSWSRSSRVSRMLRFFKSVLLGVVENRLACCGILIFLFVDEPRLLLTFACLRSGLHGLMGAFPFVLDAVCSVSVFCERLWEMTVVCCKCSCIMCKAFVTRSSETCSGFCAGEAVAEESSHPSQALLHRCFHRELPCHWA